MKNTVLALFLLISLVGNTQKGAHNVSLGFSDNGQLSPAMTDYYFVWYYAVSTTQYKRLALKADLAYSYITAKGLEFGLTAGYGQRTENYRREIEEVETAQHYASVMPFILKGWQFNAVQISAGGGIPCYRINDYNANQKTPYASARMNITGGEAFGISGLMRLKWNVTKRWSLNGLVNYGVLYMDYGEKQVYDSYDSQGNITGTAYSFSKQKRTLVPSPELSLSIGFRI